MAARHRQPPHHERQAADASPQRLARTLESPVLAWQRPSAAGSTLQPGLLVLGMRLAEVGPSLITSVLYIAGVLGLIYGERSVPIGKDPLLSFGGASLPAGLLLAGGVAVLIVMRPEAKALDAVVSTTSSESV